MATGVTTQKIGSSMIVDVIAHVPGSSSSVPVTSDSGTTKYWKPLINFGVFGVGACNHTLTGNGITNISIYAATDSTGTNATLILSSAVLAGTAVGNGGFLEVMAEQVREVGAAASFNFTYVTGYITVQNSSDKCSVVFLRTDPRWAQLNLTPLSF